MKFSLEQAKAIAENLKKKYKFGTKACPKWFSNTCIPMRQDGSYSVEVCIPSWSSITEQENNAFLEPFEGCIVHLRVVTIAPKYDYEKRDAEIKEKKNAKKEKRRTSRKGYR